MNNVAVQDLTLSWASDPELGVRTGHAALRKALYMPGAGGIAHNPILQVFGVRMKANGLAPKAVVGTAMRKLAHLIYGVVKSGKPFDANFATNRLAVQDGI